MIATQVKGIPGGGRAAAAERHSKKNWTKFALPPPPMKQLPAKESNLRKQQQQKSTVLISNSMQSSSSSSELQSTPGSKCCRSVDVVDSNCSSSSSFKTGKDYAIGARVSSSYLVSKNNKKKKSLHLKPGGGGRESSSSTVAVAKLYSIANSFSFQPPSPIPEVQQQKQQPPPQKKPTWKTSLGAPKLRLLTLESNQIKKQKLDFPA
jgi:hypothetical protein